MQLEGLTIALRARTPWEATDLGIALVRAHASRIYAAWILTTLPAFVLLNGFGLLLGKPWLAALALWWLKPVFDRIPLYVISRAVFGSVPSLRETLVAQRQWGWRGTWRWLHWRRFHPGRAMLLPVDLLEGETGAQRRERVRVLSRANASPNVMLTVIGVNVEGMLGISLVLLGLMFVPVEFLSDSAKSVWRTLFETPPLWAQACTNLIGWITITIVEPFYVGAGFGLYLNRRMQLEAWDIELAFRRMAVRLLPPLAAAGLLFVAVCAFSSPLRAAVLAPGGDSVRIAATIQAAQDEDPADDSTPASGDEPFKKLRGDKANKDTDIESTLQKMFAGSYRDDGADFEASVTKAYGADDLSPKVKQFIWKRRNRLDENLSEPSEMPAWAKPFGLVLGFAAEFGLWILAALAVIFVVANHRRWLPWISDRFAAARVADEIGVHEVTAADDHLPDDVAAAVRALWRQGSMRAALALLYRAGVERLSERLGTPLPPGATESECLRQSRRLRDTGEAMLFARIVRCWQAAAYAQRMPLASEVEAMLADWNTPPVKEAT
jgi:hypothetical protein